MSEQTLQLLYGTPARLNPGCKQLGRDGLLARWDRMGKAGRHRGATQGQLALLWKQERTKSMECGLELDRLGSNTNSATYQLCDLG